jgi:hypothetical protein
MKNLLIADACCLGRFSDHLVCLAVVAVSHLLLHSLLQEIHQEEAWESCVLTTVCMALFAAWMVQATFLFNTDEPAY